MQIINQESHLTYNIIEYDVVDSTMIVAKNFPENMVVVAKKQEKARGKGNRVWNAEDNNNLYFSVNLKAGRGDLDYSQLSFVSSVAMRQAIEKYDANGNSIVSKWPNDILINSKKCCGILLEFDYATKMLVIGIGVNIDFFPDGTMFKATSLRNEKIIVARYDLLSSFLDNFSYLLGEWERRGFEPIREKWLQSCYKLNEEIMVDGRKGVFKNIDNDGTLVMGLEDGSEFLVKSGDVF